MRAVPWLFAGAVGLTLVVYLGTGNGWWLAAAVALPWVAYLVVYRLGRASRGRSR